MQPIHLAADAGAPFAIQSISDEERDGTLAQDAAGPVAIEVGEALADARAARPILNRACDAIERDVDILLPQVSRDVGEPCAEEEGIDAIAVVGDGVHEMKEEPAVATHGAGYIAEHDERRRAAAAALALQCQEPAGAKLRAHGGAHV